MRQPLIAHHQTVALMSAVAVPRDRTSRADKALTHCKEEWTRAYEIAEAKGLTATKALRMAAVAYKLAMPNLNDLPSIRAAISCIAQGIRLEVFDGRDGSQLLYSAQVAMSLLHKKDKKG